METNKMTSVPDCAGHTPGPYSWSAIGDDTAIMAYPGPSRCVVARVVADARGDRALFASAYHAPHLCDDPTCPGHLNARKLAALDDIRDALQNVLAKMPYGANWDDDGRNPQWLKDARAALDAIEGSAAQ